MDADLSFSSFLALYEADVSERRVPARWSAEALDVVEYAGPRLVARAVEHPVHSVLGPLKMLLVAG